MHEVRVEIRFADDGFPDAELLEKRDALEDFIVGRGLGEFLDAGSGTGVVELFVETPDVDALIEAVRPVVRDLGIAHMTRITKVV
jgi:hypothetical protein